MAMIATPVNWMNGIAESYVKFVLAMGNHDADYVDAYYGPPEWKAEARKTKRTLVEIRTEADALIGRYLKNPGPLVSA